MSTVIRKCNNCGEAYPAKTADVKRGWGLSCSKSCAARTRTRRERKGSHKSAAASLRYSKPSTRTRYADGTHSFSSEALGQY